MAFKIPESNNDITRDWLEKNGFYLTISHHRVFTQKVNVVNAVYQFNTPAAPGESPNTLIHATHETTDVDKKITMTLHNARKLNGMVGSLTEMVLHPRGGSTIVDIRKNGHRIKDTKSPVCRCISICSPKDIFVRKVGIHNALSKGPPIIRQYLEYIQSVEQQAGNTNVGTDTSNV